MSSEVNKYLKEQYGFEEHTNSKCGTFVEYKTYRRNREISNKDFMEILDYVVKSEEKRFRNFVISTTDGWFTSRYITISKDKILSKGATLSEGLSYIIERLSNGDLEEVYDNYNEGYSAHLGAKGNKILDYYINTSSFDVALNIDKGKLSGGKLENWEITNIINLSYGLQDCFYRCIKGELFNDISEKRYYELVKEIKKTINYDTGILIEDIHHAEKILNIKVVVFADRLVNNKLHILYNSDTRNDRIVYLILNGCHYSVYKGTYISPSTKEELELERESPKVKLFYDMETYMDPNDNYTTKVYCFSCCIVGEGDTRTIVIVKTTEDDNIEQRIYEFIRLYLIFGTCTIIGFNNGAFDDYILLRILFKFTRGIRETYIDKSSRILSFGFNGMRSKDLYRFVLCKLSDATKSFNCNTIKGELDHDEIQNHVNNGTFTEWITKNKEKLLTYAITDVISTKELYFKLEKTFKSLNEKLLISNTMTLAQMSMTAFKHDFEKVDDHGRKEVLPILSKEEDDIIRKALVGARCQIFNPYIEEEHYVQCIDVVSLYPFIMMNYNFPYSIQVHGTLPVEGRRKRGYHDVFSRKWMIKTNMFITDKVGVYKVIILHQPKDKIIPYRKDDNTLDWNYSHKFITWTDSNSLNTLSKYGGNFSVIEGYYFNTPCKPIFRDYLSNIMNQKLHQDELRAKNSKEYNKELRECAKLLMNSLSGKMGQNPIDKEKRICDTENKCDEMINKYFNNATVLRIGDDNTWIINGTINDENLRITSPSIIAVLIYSYARSYMYENFISKVEYKFGMDTDSLFLRSSELCKIDSRLFGSKPGQIKTELPNDSFGIYISKKVYANYNKDGEIYRFKFRGLGIKDKFIPYELVDKITKEIEKRNNKELKKIYDELTPMFNTIHNMKRMLNYQKVYTLTKQIQRYFNKGLIIQENYVIKTYTKNQESDPM